MGVDQAVSKRRYRCESGRLRSSAGFVGEGCGEELWRALQPGIQDVECPEVGRTVGAQPPAGLRSEGLALGISIAGDGAVPIGGAEF